MKGRVVQESLIKEWKTQGYPPKKTADFTLCFIFYLILHSSITIVIRTITNVLKYSRPITLVKHFSDRLRHARVLRGLSQAELARAAGLSQSAISNYENNSRRDSRALFELAAILRVNPLWLAQGLGPMETQPDPPMETVRPAAGVIAEQSLWPFNRVSPSDYWALMPSERTIVEDTVSNLVRAFGKKHPHR